MKNFLLLFFVRLLQRFIKKSDDPNRILIVSTTALGDTLWATPALASLRQSFPKARLCVLVSETGRAVLENSPYIDKLFVYRLSLWRTLLKERFSTVLVFHTSRRLVLPLCACLGATRIVGTCGIHKGLDALLTHPLKSKRQHEIARRLEIIEQIGASVHSEALSYFPKGKKEKKEGLWIALHPGAKDAFKHWPLFAPLGRRLKEELGCEILITGTETKLKRELARLVEGAHIDESPSLDEFAQKLSQVDLLISNDTGSFHLALALGTPAVAIYGATDPVLCGPYKAKNASALFKARCCTPCLKRKCKSPFCLLQIGVEEVVQAAKQYAKKSA